MNDPLVALRAALRGWQANLWTAIPATVDSYDAGKLTVSAQPAVQVQVRGSDGAWTDTTLPLCVDCPVVFPAGGGFALTFPLAKGDEGLLIFASRCIDGWWQSGGVQPQAEVRMHDLSDGFFLPGVFSQPRKLSSVATEAVDLRSGDDQVRVRIKAGEIDMTSDGGTSGIKVAPGTTTVTGNLVVTGTATLQSDLQLGGSLKSATGSTYAGSFSTTGDITAGSGGADQVSLRSHKHTSAAPGAPTSSPTPGT